MVQIEIDGIEILVSKGSMIMDAVDKLGVKVPRFCYHKSLSVSANCRMCLVEVEKIPKVVPACATPVADGMKVFTKSSKVIKAQKAVMEFLLINHPLDCPVCDQGGECELQDVSFEYGNYNSNFSLVKRVVDDHDFGSLINTDMTRCILCTRCVRFSSEIAGVDEMGVVGRGVSSKVTTFVKKTISSELSGNMIDICPVGALTSKPFRFKARPWELKQNFYVSPHDCFGSNLNFHVYENKVMRVVPKENFAINDSWISDRDRFSYEGVYSDDRLNSPMIKENGNWKEVSWTSVLSFIGQKLLNVLSENGPNEIGCLISPNSSLEEFYLIQKFFRKLGCNNIDHRLRQRDFRNQEKFPLYPGMDVNLNDINKYDSIFLVGTFVNKEFPILNFRLNKFAKLGKKIFTLNPISYEFPFEVYKEIFAENLDFTLPLLKIIKFIFSKSSKKQFKNFKNSIENVELSQDESLIGEELISSKTLIIIGNISQINKDYSKILSLCDLISKLTDSFLSLMTIGSNSAGGWLSGCVPHRLPGGISLKESSFGKNSLEMLKKSLKSYFLFGIEPDKDTCFGVESLKILKESDFVLSVSPYKSKSLLDCSDVLLPMFSQYEMSGTFININGIRQSFKGLEMTHCELSKSGWDIIKSISDSIGIYGFDYKNFNSVSLDVKNKIICNKNTSFDFFDPRDLDYRFSKFKDNKGSFVRIFDNFLYCSDNLVRRAKSLQKVNELNYNHIFFSLEAFNKLDLKEGDTYNFIINDKLVELIPFIFNKLTGNYVIINNENFNFSLFYENLNISIKN